MKKNSLFSFKLYCEGLRQTRVFAIVILILMFINVGISFSSCCIEMAQDGAFVTQGIVDPINLNPMQFLIFLVCAPIMTLSLFKFLNKRNQSDFYHAIPHPRQCIAISFLAAALTWIVVFSTIPVLCSALLFRLFLFKAWTLDIALLFSGILNTIVLSLLVMSVFFLAMTITGTGFSNAIVALLILFLPRFFLMVINLTFSFDIIPASSLAFPFGPFNMLINFLFSADISGKLYPFDGPALLYTVGLTLFYFVLGVLLFKRRPSEAAGNPAPTRKIQALHRITVTCAIAFPLTLFLFSEPPTDADTILLYVVGYIVAIVAYFLYELLSTLTVRRMAKIIPGLLIVAVLCFGGTLISKGIYSLLINDVPKAENVKEIYIEGLGNHYDFDNSYSYDGGYNYFEEKAGKLPIADKACIEITTRCLDHAVTELKKDRHIVFPDQNWAKVKFVCKNGHTVTRFVPILPNIEDFNTLKATLASNPDYENVYVNLPAFKNNFATDLSCGAPSEVISTDQRREIYNSLREELKTKDAEKWIAQLNNEDFHIPFATLYVYIPENGKTLYMSLPICELTPKTYTLLQNMIAANNDPKAFKEAMLLPTDTDYNTFNSKDWNIEVAFVHDGIYVQRINCYARRPFFEEDGSQYSMDDKAKASLVSHWNSAVTYIADHSSPTFDITKDYIIVTAFQDSYSATSADKFQNFYLFLSTQGETVGDDLLFLNEFADDYNTPLVEQFVPADSDVVSEPLLVD